MPTRRPWDPDRRWADPLIALLALLALLAATLSLGARKAAARRPAERASLQGRLSEVALAGPRLLRPGPVPPAEWTRLQARLTEPWDRALLAVLRAELGPELGAGAAAEALPGLPAGEPWTRGFAAAYGGGPLPDAAARGELRRRLGEGHAAALLEARLLDREGAGGEALRARARQALMTRLALLGGLGAALLLLAVGGLAAGAYLWATRHRPPARPLPAWGLSGRAAALVLLGWFLAFFAAGNLAALLLAPWPTLRWAAVPLATLLHAGVGSWLVARAEGLGLRALLRRLAPRPTARDLGWSLAFLGLALVLVLAVSLAAGPLLRPDQSPQRDLQELLRSLRGWGPSLLMFAVVAGLAPAFEELLFRGLLLPVLARRTGLGAALLLSALLFGAIHLQPAGLPTLATLGFALGLALRQRGSLWPPILVHGAWNGTLFLLMRAFA